MKNTWGTWKGPVYPARVGWLLAAALLAGALGACGGGGGTGGGPAPDAGLDGAADGGSDGNAGCRSDSDCDDGDPCNGAETCDASSGSCQPASAPAPDGTSCDVDPDVREICRSGSCTRSTCGDGFLDMAGGEVCDDGNTDDGDGCDRDCSFSCTDDADCDDGNPCNGAETCSSDNRCEAGTMADDGEVCDADDDASTRDICRSGSCVASTCGDGFLDMAGGEVCDDGNTDDGDGCDRDCSFSCEDDADCDDGNPCNGAETCSSDNRCEAGTPVSCADDGFDCTFEVCVPQTATAYSCISVLIDRDGDGYAPEGLSCDPRRYQSGDCDDENPDVHPDASDPCSSADGIDQNCSGTPDDEGIRTFYPDCDGDGFAAAGAPAVQSCEAPPSTPPTAAQCPHGMPSGVDDPWTTEPPDPGHYTADCHDGNANVHRSASGATVPYTAPDGSESYDYNCDGVETPTENRVASCLEMAPGVCIGNFGWGDSVPSSCGSAGDYYASESCAWDDTTGGCAFILPPESRRLACL